VNEKNDIAPQHTQKTQIAYSKRWRQLFVKARRELRIIDPKPMDVARWLHGHAQKVSRSTMRQYRAAAMEYCFRLRRFSLEENVPAIDEAIKILGAIDPSNCLQKAASTSATKMKDFPEHMVDAVLNELADRESARSRDLVWLLKASLLAGARPVEWERASWTFHPEIGAGSLKFYNAKNTQNRAHGPTRLLLFTSIENEDYLVLDSWTKRARDIGRQRNFERYMHDLQDLLADTLRGLFPRLKSYPTLYSCRHAAIARWKATYMAGPIGSEEWLHGAAVIAAMAGHATDLTASQHYARGRKGKQSKRSFPMPQADPDEVSRIRPKILAQTERMLSKRQTLNEATKLSLSAFMK
jgi:hypothetical protein